MLFVLCFRRKSVFGVFVRGLFFVYGVRFVLVFIGRERGFVRGAGFFCEIRYLWMRR